MSDVSLLAENMISGEINTEQNLNGNMSTVDGKDGISPTVEITETESGHRISITDVNGTQTFDMNDGINGKDGVDGKDGKDGKDGVSVTHSWEGTTLTIMSASGVSSTDLKGDQGPQGEPGKDYTLTDTDKMDIANILLANFTDVSEVGQ